MQGHPTRCQVIWAAVMHSVPEGSCVSWRTEDESGQPKALAVALSFCRLLGLGCPKQAFAKIATLFGWLKDHPQKERIAQRYFRNLHSFSREALERLKQEEPILDADEESLGEVLLADTNKEALEETISTEKKISLNKQRYQVVKETLMEHKVETLLDLGCGEGRLLNLLKSERGFSKLSGCDASIRVLEIAQERLKPDRQRRDQPSIELFQSALTYRDKRFSAFDAITLIEVIEHIDQPRLGALERVVFDSANPRVAIVTTPNSEYNVLFENLPQGKFRHSDHRFEWTRTEFERWAGGIAENYGYAVTFTAIGEVSPEHGAPTQMAVFVKQTTTEEQAA
jgi:3' terminal RNA ribose 2'-O-methyltransferase Hen1